MPSANHSRLLCALFFVAGAFAVCAAVAGYLYLGHPPVAVSDPPLPFERFIAHEVLHRRIDREPMTVPSEGTAAELVAGARTYKQQCAVCHGIPGKKADIGAHMFPSAPQLWTSHRAGVVGVSDDPVGETLWKVKNGIRLSGMPSFDHTLTFAEMWQVSLLLHQANQTLSPAVMAELTGTSGATQK